MFFESICITINQFVVFSSSCGVAARKARNLAPPHSPSPPRPLSPGPNIGEFVVAVFVVLFISYNEFMCADVVVFREDSLYATQN